MTLNISSRAVMLVAQRTLILLVLIGVLSGSIGGIYWYVRLRPDRFIDVRDQALVGRSLTLKRVTMPKAGFVVIRIYKEYPSTGGIYAMTGKLNAGNHMSQLVTFFRDEWLAERAPKTMIATIHADVDGDGFFTDLDSEPLLDESGAPIERVFTVKEGTAVKSISCSEGFQEDFNDATLDLSRWEPLFETEVHDGAIAQPITYGSVTRLPTKMTLEGDFDVMATYRSFSVSPVPKESTFTRLTAFSGPYEHALALTWFQDDTGSYVTGMINNIPGTERFAVPNDAALTLHLRRIGTTAEVSVKIGDTETVIQRGEDAPTVPVYIGLHTEDTGGPIEPATAIIDAVNITCP